MPLVLPSPPAGERRRAASPGTCASHGGLLARSRGPAGRPRPTRVPHPEGAGRHRAHRLPRSPRAPARQAGGRSILPRPRAPRSPSRLHLSLHGRHGDGAAAGFPPHVLGARLRRHEARARPCHLAPRAVAAGDGAGLLRLLPRGRHAHRGSPTVGPAPPARPRGPAGLHHQDRVGARAATSTASPSTRRAPAATTPSHPSPATSRTTTSCRLEGGGTGPRRPEPHGGARGCRWSSPRANGAGARRRSTCATPRPSRWPTATCSTSTASRRSPGSRGAAVTFMAKPDMRRRRVVLPPALLACGTAGAPATSSRRAGRRQGTPLFGQWVAGQMALARELSFFYAPTVNAYKRYQARLVRAHAPRLRAGTTARAAFASAGKGPASASRTASPGPTPIRTSPSRPPSPRACTGSSGGSRRPAGTRATPTRTRPAPGAEDAPGGARRAGAVARCPGRLRRRRGRALPAPRVTSSSRPSTRR